jgi:hypothetical protein
MTTPNSRTTLAVAGRVRAAAVELASGLVGGFKRSDRTFRRKAAVVGTWFLLSLMTMWAACPSSGPSNSLGAEARLQATSVGLVLSVHNDTDGSVWSDVTLTLDDTWRYDRRRTIRAGDTVTPRLEDFRKDGEPPPADYRPQKLTVQCQQGRVSIPLGDRR